MLPRSSRAHYRNTQRLKVATILAVRRAWAQMAPGRNWREQYREEVGPALATVVLAAQVAATRESDAYIAAVLNELNFGPASVPGAVLPNALAGWAGDGRPVATLLEGTVVKAARSLSQELEELEADARRTLQATETQIQQALNDALPWLEMTVETILADTIRATEDAATAAREWVPGYIRMLNPPSCSRCAVLAGRYYRWNDGFDRHPRCDCVHIPASEADAGDLRVDPDAYFRSLDPAQQDRIFTNAGAQAIRDGADITKVVNARRGMSTAARNQRGWIPKGRLAREDTFGRGVYVTTEGVTRRGGARKAMGPGRPFRLMPESIYELAAGDRAEAIRLLRLYGYLTS